MKLEGMKAGVPDIFMAHPCGKWHGLFIEFKAGKNQPTEAQLLMMIRFEAEGYLCKVAYTVADAIAITDQYLLSIK